MEKHTVFNTSETSWADQWDPEPAYGNGYYSNKNNGSSKTAKISSKASETFDKTKAVASTGAKKIKEGTRAGFHWIKEKYQKTTQKH
ncbi:OLC1v1028152C1 [Oldenlandia corymbosa var. corymbosa]|uniref:OLC1v1028152C1 n=1 Tax=Oldenlandia corymbosa var. corymbosa TaxID=529605 RepID=A0AAV1CB42_OLDCO|nr:OLC1v1028152C1 [Oldenlandia corymbosa var. corymbosa]